MSLSSRVRDLLLAHRFHFASEAQLQAGIARVLDAAGVPYQREAVLTPQDRPDFLLHGGLAIEVKVGGSVASLARQVERYAALDAVGEILVVTTRMQHRVLPAAANGKPVHLTYLIGSCL